MTRALATLIVCVSLLPAQRLKDLETTSHIKPGDAIVIGFLGGFESWNDETRSVRKLVLKLRTLPGVHAESISNRNLSTAKRFIEAAPHSKIIIFGQSLGGNATIQLARELRRPVELTAQVDSVGFHDGVIPPNVRTAVNYFQHDPLTIWGRAHIRAADSTHTRILGNYEREYPMFDPTLMAPEASWTRKYFGGGHARMEADSQLWAEIEHLIHRALKM